MIAKPDNVVLRTRSAPWSQLAELVIRYQRSGDQWLRNYIAESCTGLVRAVAAKLAIQLPRHLDLDEMVSDGYAGLTQAIDRFDPRKGVSFKWYAACRIRGSILDHLRERDWVPRLARSRHKRFQQFYTAFVARNGHPPTLQQVRRGLKLSAKGWRIWRADLRLLQREQPPDMTSGMANWDECMACWSQGREPPVETALANRDLAEAILRVLPARERQIMRLYYLGQHTMKEVAQVVGVGESRISQLLSQSTAKLQKLARRGYFARLNP